MEQQLKDRLIPKNGEYQIDPHTGKWYKREEAEQGVSMEFFKKMFGKSFPGF